MRSAREIEKKFGEHKEAARVYRDEAKVCKNEENKKTLLRMAQDREVQAASLLWVLKGE